MIQENHLPSEPSTLQMSYRSPRPSFDNISHSSTSSTPTPKGSQKSMLSGSNFSYSIDDIGGRTGEGPEIHDVKVVFIKYPDECCPACCTKICSCLASLDQNRAGKVWSKFRLYMFRLVENNYFETFIIIMILLSSLALVSNQFAFSLSIHVCHSLFSCIIIIIITINIILITLCTL